MPPATVLGLPPEQPRHDGAEEDRPFHFHFHKATTPISATKVRSPRK